MTTDLISAYSAGLQASTQDDEDYRKILQNCSAAHSREKFIVLQAPPRSPPPLFPPDDDRGRSLRDSDLNEALLCNRFRLHLTASEPTHVRFKASNKRSSPLTGVIKEDLIENSAPCTLLQVWNRLEQDRFHAMVAWRSKGSTKVLHVMTDAEKQRLGILPESIYMTANLEQWGEELEHMSIHLNTATSTKASAASYQVPQVTFLRDTPPLGTYDTHHVYYLYMQESGNIESNYQIAQKELSFADRIWLSLCFY